MYLPSRKDGVIVFEDWTFEPQLIKDIAKVMIPRLQSGSEFCVPGDDGDQHSTARRRWQHTVSASVWICWPDLRDGALHGAAVMVGQNLGAEK